MNCVKKIIDFIGLMEVRETEEGYLRKFIPLCVVEFFFFVAYVMGIFVATEYGHEAIRDFNQTTSNNSDKSHCETNTSSASFIEEQKVQKEVSNWNVYIFIAQGVPLIFASIVFAPLSDRVGRKIFLFIGVGGVCIKQLLMTLAIAFEWNIFLFIPFTLVEGCTGSWVVFLAITFSMMSDISSGQSRSFLIAVISFVLGVGFSMGNFIPGYAISSVGFTYSMAISCSICFFSVLGMCFVPETLPPERRSTVKFHCIDNFKDILQFYIKSDDLTSSECWKYIIGLSAFSFVMLARLGTGFELLFLINSPFCFSPVKISVFETAKTVLSEVVILIGIKLFQKCFSDEIIALIGSVSSVASFVLFGIAQSAEYLYVGMYMQVGNN